jgi:transcriptional regulator with XRE-family HTH domain
MNCPFTVQGEKIRTARTAKGLSLEDLSKKLTGRGYKVTAAAIALWEKGAQLPKVPTAVADLLDLSVRDIVR